MDPLDRAQVLLLCDLCQRAALQNHCELCKINLCKACVGEHLSDSSKRHNVVPYKHRTSTPNYPACPNHSKKHCELFCEKCDIPVCSICISSDKHHGHKFTDVLETIDSKKKDLIKDLEELEKRIYPTCEEITIELNNEKEKEINQITTEVKQSILNLKKILDSNDVSLTSVYKSRNAEFRSLPPRVNVSLPRFSPHQINTEQLHQMFGFLSALSITTEEHGYTMKTPEAVSCPPVKPLLNEPELITTINTGFGALHSVTCLSDEEIWTCGNDSIMKLYNLQGKLLKSIQTKSGYIPEDITATKSGDLVYTDPTASTVNIVKDRQIQEVIGLQRWRPSNICSTSSVLCKQIFITVKTADIKDFKFIRIALFPKL
ncbi:E3 ubiquitin-protein ligase TRIM71-like [Saccostrea cucullata]|uniref:E3 ubiquitin-protein ligase TRIM71-like n=1 Tax=Saccostrea cuccullata TaxID=36930 RepID=UPI002ED30CDD